MKGKRGRKPLQHIPGGKKRRGAGTRGPRPEPTAAIERRGGRPRKDRGRDPEKEPQPPKYSKAPKCPAWVDHPYAREAWRRLAPQLQKCGILTKADPMTLARYCVAFGVWRTCAEFVMRHGVAFPLRGKQVAPDKPAPVIGMRSYPQARFLNTYAMQLIQLERELGLTPAARARLEVDLPAYDGEGESPQTDAAGDPYFAAG